MPNSHSHPERMEIDSISPSPDCDPLPRPPCPVDGENQAVRIDSSIPTYSSSPADGEKNDSSTEIHNYSWSPAEGEQPHQNPTNKPSPRVEQPRLPPTGSGQPRVDHSGDLEPRGHVVSERNENNTRMGVQVGTSAIRQLLKAPQNDVGEDGVLPILPVEETGRKARCPTRSKSQKSRNPRKAALDASVAVGSDEEGHSEGGVVVPEDVPLYSNVGSGLPPWVE